MKYHPQRQSKIEAMHRYRVKAGIKIREHINMCIDQSVEDAI